MDNKRGRFALLDPTANVAKAPKPANAAKASEAAVNAENDSSWGDQPLPEDIFSDGFEKTGGAHSRREVHIVTQTTQMTQMYDDKTSHARKRYEQFYSNVPMIIEKYQEKGSHLVCVSLSTLVRKLFSNNESFLSWWIQNTQKAAGSNGLRLADYLGGIMCRNFHRLAQKTKQRFSLTDTPVSVRIGQTPNDYYDQYLINHQNVKVFKGSDFTVYVSVPSTDTLTRTVFGQISKFVFEEIEKDIRAFVAPSYNMKDSDFPCHRLGLIVPVDSFYRDMVAYSRNIAEYASQFSIDVMGLKEDSVCNTITFFTDGAGSYTCIRSLDQFGIQACLLFLELCKMIAFFAQKTTTIVTLGNAKVELIKNLLLEIAQSADFQVKTNFQKVCSTTRPGLTFIRPIESLLKSIVRQYFESVEADIGMSTFESFFEYPLPNEYSRTLSTQNGKKSFADILSCNTTFPPPAPAAPAAPAAPDAPASPAAPAAPAPTQTSSPSPIRRPLTPIALPTILSEPLSRTSSPLGSLHPMESSQSHQGLLMQPPAYAPPAHSQAQAQAPPTHYQQPYVFIPPPTSQYAMAAPFYPQQHYHHPYGSMPSQHHAMPIPMSADSDYLLRLADSIRSIALQQQQQQQPPQHQYHHRR